MISIIHEARTEYNRKAKQWQTLNGKVIATFPPGPEGKRLAQLEALEINRPDLATLVHRAIKSSQEDTRLFNMALKAAAVIQDGLLYSNGACHSQSRAGVVHAINFDSWPKTYSCSCEAFSHCPVYVEDVGFLCKHCLASHWAYLLDIDLPQQPVPFNGEPTAWPDE